MSESYFQLSSKDKADALNVAATISGRPPHLLEKDIWVVWSLAALFESQFGSVSSCRARPKPSSSSATCSIWRNGPAAISFAQIPVLTARSSIARLMA